MLSGRVNLPVNHGLPNCLSLSPPISSPALLFHLLEKRFCPFNAFIVIFAVLRHYWAKLLSLQRPLGIREQERENIHCFFYSEPENISELLPDVNHDFSNCCS